MGDKFTVEAWTQVIVCVDYPGRVISAVAPADWRPCENNAGDPPDTERTYKYITHYSGNSFFAALRRLIALKREGYGCVKMEWR